MEKGKWCTPSKENRITQLLSAIARFVICRDIFQLCSTSLPSERIRYLMCVHIMWWSYFWSPFHDVGFYMCAINCAARFCIAAKFIRILLTADPNLTEVEREKEINIWNGMARCVQEILFLCWFMFWESEIKCEECARILCVYSKGSSKLLTAESYIYSLLFILNWKCIEFAEYTLVIGWI